MLIYIDIDIYAELQIQVIITQSRLFGLHVLFSGSKFLINLRRQFCVRKIFRTQLFAGFEVILCIKLLFRRSVTYVAH